MLSALSLASTSFAPATVAAPRAAVQVRMDAMSMPEEPPAPPPLPKIKTMMVGDKTLAGDMGFDPLQLADNSEKLAFYREAEVKHARLAMLAAFGWPISEITNFGNLLTKDGRAPSLLNGGLGNVNGVYWAAVLGFAPLGADSEGMRGAEITNGRVAMMAITAYALEEALTKAPIFPISLFH